MSFHFPSPCTLSFNDQNVMKHVLAVYLKAHMLVHTKYLQPTESVSSAHSDTYHGRH